MNKSKPVGQYYLSGNAIPNQTPKPGFLNLFINHEFSTK